jgi:hypothetical protein
LAPRCCVQDQAVLLRIAERREQALGRFSGHGTPYRGPGRISIRFGFAAQAEQRLHAQVGPLGIAARSRTKATAAPAA